MEQENNESEIKKSYVIFTIIAGMLTLLPLINNIILSNLHIYINNPNIMVQIYVLGGIIGYSIYFLKLKNMKRYEKVLSIIACVPLLLSLLFFNYYENGNGEWSGFVEAILYVNSILTYEIFSIIVFMSYSIRNIFSKLEKNTNIKILLGILILVVLLIINQWYIEFKINEII